MTKQQLRVRLRERVRAGMALLDFRKPGWRHKIDLEKLDLRSCQSCVLGEVYGDYCLGMSTLFPHDENSTSSRSEVAQSLGFYLNNDRHYNDLTAVWRAEYRRGQQRALIGG